MCVAAAFYGLNRCEAGGNSDPGASYDRVLCSVISAGVKLVVSQTQARHMNVCCVLWAHP